MSNPHYAAQKLSLVNQRITQACRSSGRARSEVTLIGASKKQSAELVSEFVNCGLAHIGENYLQEAIEKQSRLAGLSPTWHFIGQIQSNKTKLIAEHFSWVHGVDRLKIAKRLASQNPSREPINLLLQLNPDAEDSKGGVLLSDAPELAAQIAELDGARLRGFMMIPKPRKNLGEQRAVFAEATELLEQTNQRYHLALDQLSMGMSSDLEAAVREGSTMIRVGTDLFGERS